MLPAYMREMKKYHLAHHYKNFELGFGVTSAFMRWYFGPQLMTFFSPIGKIWDYVFNTALPA
jgi:4-hydroxysphinganine ceramide fatty acyl 2-hydroxylase